MLQHVVRILDNRLPANEQRRLRMWLRRLRVPARSRLLRSTRPLSDTWGFDRGTPIDRYYIQRFLQDYRADIHGRILEVKDSEYSRRFGERIEHIDILDIDPKNSKATVIADLAAADDAPSDRFDCFVLTQTLQFIYDHEAAVKHAWRMLRPGGVLLATVPSVSRLAPRYGIEGEFWRYTPASCRRLFGGMFGADHVVVRSYGNVLAGIAFLTGMAIEELSAAELDVQDDYFPVLIGVRATKEQL